MRPFTATHELRHEVFDGIRDNPFDHAHDAHDHVDVFSTVVFSHFGGMRPWMTGRCAAHGMSEVQTYLRS